jgi:hypothetical protein
MSYGCTWPALASSARSCAEHASVCLLHGADHVLTSSCLGRAQPGGEKGGTSHRPCLQLPFAQRSRGSDWHVATRLGSFSSQGAHQKAIEYCLLHFALFGHLALHSDAWLLAGRATCCNCCMYGMLLGPPIGIAARSRFCDSTCLRLRAQCQRCARWIGRGKGSSGSSLALALNISSWKLTSNR